MTLFPAYGTDIHLLRGSTKLTQKRKALRFRRAYTFTISLEAVAVLRALAARLELSYSRTLEMFLRADYSKLFDAFRKKEPFASIVIRTGYPPMLIRELYREYSAGFEPLEGHTLDKQIELARIRLQTTETAAASRERRALISKTTRVIESEAMVRAARVAASAKRAAR